MKDRKEVFPPSLSVSLKFHSSPLPALICPGKLIPTLPQSTFSPLSWVRWGELAGDLGRGVGRERLGYFFCICPAGLGLWKRLHFSKATNPAHGPSPQATASPCFQKRCLLTCHSEGPRDRLATLSSPQRAPAAPWIPFNCLHL